MEPKAANEIDRCWRHRGGAGRETGEARIDLKGKAFGQSIIVFQSVKSLDIVAIDRGRRFVAVEPNDHHHAVLYQIDDNADFMSKARASGPPQTAELETITDTQYGTVLESVAVLLRLVRHQLSVQVDQQNCQLAVVG